MYVNVTLSHSFLELGLFQKQGSLFLLQCAALKSKKRALQYANKNRVDVEEDREAMAVGIARADLRH